jgi:isoquinoline 1-oxidoreductase subunit alpha
MPLFKLLINARIHEVDVDADTPLLWVLRDELDLKGTKYGCGIGQCGACSVHLNGAAVRSCSVTVSAVQKGKITTIEGLGGEHLSPLQKAWIELDVPQCGYCQAGQIMTAAALLSKNRKPTDDQIRTAMNGNLCRCGTYTRIQAAVKQASVTKEGRN